MPDKFAHGGEIDVLSKKTGRKLIDFSANINPMGLAQSVRQAIEEGIDDIIHYPDVRMTALREKIGELYDIDSGSIIMGNGAVELIYILCRVLQPRNVLIPSPTFSEYERAARTVDAHIEYFKLDERKDFAIDLARLIVSLKGKNLLFLCNPNNPTGALLDLRDVTLLVEHAEANGCFVVIDESFMDFISNKEEFSAKSLLKSAHNLLVINSLTKFFALPGLRLGFAACPDVEVIKRMYANKDPWNVNVLAQKAGFAALSDSKYQRHSRSYIRSEINYLSGELTEFKKLKIYKPSVNFILINIHDTGIASGELCAKMLEKGIMIRDCANYPGLSTDFIRIAVKKREENDILLDAFENILQ